MGESLDAIIAKDDIKTWYKVVVHAKFHEKFVVSEVTCVEFGETHRFANAATTVRIQPRLLPHPAHQMTECSL